MRLFLLLLMCSGLTVAAGRRYGMLPHAEAAQPMVTTLQVPVEIVDHGGTIERRQVVVSVEP